MLTILRGISITCFFTSYIVVLVLELLRIWGRIPGRGIAVILMMSIGLFTHVMYLALARDGWRSGGRRRTLGDLDRLVTVGFPRAGRLLLDLLPATPRHRRQFFLFANDSGANRIGSGGP